VEPTEANRRAWDEVHRRRAEAMAGRLGIPDVVRERLPDVAGKRVLHLQCATGESTAGLVELGALVTGVDIANEALAVARTKAPGATFIHGDVQALPPEVRRGRFDLVYTETGIVCWLHDLDAWAGGIAAALRDGGELVFFDGHPIAGCVDAAMRWRDDYFDESPIVATGWGHFDLPGEPATEQKVERFWRIGQIVNAIAQAGLVIRQLDEFPADPTGFRRQDRRIPGDLLILASKA